MRRSQVSFILSILFAFLVIAALRPAAAQDMLPIFGMPNQPAATVTPAPAPVLQPQASPSAQAAIPPAAVVPTAPARQAQAAVVKRATATSDHRAATAEKKKFAALMKRLVPVHREGVHHETVHRVVVHDTRPDLPPPGTIVPPPGFYPPGPGPYYQHLVYGGPYRGWGGFRRPYPYYDYP